MEYELSISRTVGRKGAKPFFQRGESYWKLRIMSIPQPEFVSCTETTIRVKVKCVCGEGKVLKLQCKERHEAWPLAKELTVVRGTVEVIDLKPGTPYFLRIASRDILSNGTDVGPEVVFDTKPVDCGKGRCSIS